MPFARVTELPARLRDRVRNALARQEAPGEREVEPIFSWLRTIALPRDLVVVETPGGREVLEFPFPSDPGARPTPAPEVESRVRFVIRIGGMDGAEVGERRPRGAAVEGAGWRAVVRQRGLTVLERDTPHGAERPLRLGLGDAERRAVLEYVRTCAERFVRRESAVEDPPAVGELARLQQRAGVAVAVWTRGRLRGSIVSPPGGVLRTLGQTTVWACQDARFERLSAADLEDTVFQATLIHAPANAVSRDEVATGDAYHDKAMLLSEGTRFGVYLPEIFNVGPARQRRLSFLTESLARDKAGLPAFGPRSRLLVSEVTEIIESADRARIVLLDGPVARHTPERDGDDVRTAGEAACAWLARIQRDDGSLPLRVRTSTGGGEGLDPTRTAMTAHALAEFGVAYDIPSAVLTARRALASVGGGTASSGAETAALVLLACYRGKAAFTLAGREGVEPFVSEVSALLARSAEAGGALPPLVGAHVLSFLGLVAADLPAAAASCQSLRGQLARRFDAARGSAGSSLAEWAELAMAPPIGGELAASVRRWLVERQLTSGAFPDTTSSTFVYSRGTGKVFEVLAASHDDGPAAEAMARVLGWLLGMQYRPDSAFFIPAEHRDRVMGGLRHDHFDTDAWIDAAGHFLLGLARLVRR